MDQNKQSLGLEMQCSKRDSFHKRKGTYHQHSGCHQYNYKKDHLISCKSTTILYRECEVKYLLHFIESFMLCPICNQSVTSKDCSNIGGTLHANVTCVSCKKELIWEPSERSHFERGKKLQSPVSEQFVSAAILNNIDFKQYSSFCATAGLSNCNPIRYMDTKSKYPNEVR